MFSEFSYTHGRTCVYGRSAPELLKTYVVRNVKLNVIAVSIFLQFFLPYLSHQFARYLSVS